MLLQMVLFHSFLWLSTISLCIHRYTQWNTHTHIHTLTYTTSSLSIHVSGHLGCFQVLAVVNSAAMNTEIHAPFQLRVFIFSGYMPRSGIAGSYVTLFLLFKEISIQTALDINC